ncbi:MurR/RpiR family transcriptional regulator [Enterococcus hulanensis]|uniref:MurR/RpiR family transcriptional regulator n=1 Tax=Enterococcus hulanensis TaxID=2559929 RepID=A0ABU3EZT9_9ENTE|nr:MurR/RpiR family transcriptional regulator [Enterococcus hulanensis]MDT2600152.1 MurR/RpiR family transcriptional regulator [Enterococcus hulanensis]MDT2608965.1 MurR/RpiR family transcriptional regulator [Enterococcus hulanensis]MDT2616993.1 MurR/RpiR family transcriptional regulator [Enterococcus hulanensis]MDT2628487.1 MurR/RpiR family transcriptional regulator [Enterococcus hulanensis]MDT2655827.1 MurR/RpiR family transcriptional regulator [Enterococcus hulanensis]
MDIETRVRTYSGDLSTTDKEILAYILNHKKEVASMGVTELSKKVHVSNSSIIRLTKKLAFKGFSEMKFFLEQSLKMKSEDAAQSTLEMQTKDLEQTQRLLQQTDFTEIIKKMYQAETIYCYGTGFSQKNSLSELSQAMMYMNKRVLSFPAKREFDMNMPLISPNDLVIIISLTGETEEIKDNTTMLKMRNIPVLSITNLSKNHLAEHADYNLFFAATPFPQITNQKENFYSFISLKLVIDTLIRKYFERLE